MPDDRHPDREPTPAAGATYPAHLGYVQERGSWSLALLLGPRSERLHHFEPNPLPPSPAARQAVLARWGTHPTAQGPGEPSGWRWRERPAPVAGRSHLTADCWARFTGQPAPATLDETSERPSDADLVHVFAGMHPVLLEYRPGQRRWSMTLLLDPGAPPRHDFDPCPLPPSAEARLRVLTRWNVRPGAEGLGGHSEWTWREGPSADPERSSVTADLWVVPNTKS